jgi:nucleobase:cation symporter-1, NCS1 family
VGFRVWVAHAAKGRSPALPGGSPSASRDEGAAKEGAQGETMDSPVGLNWGIDPVPERLRVLGFLDQLLLWGNLSVSLLVIVAGALLVPALSLKDALLAIVVAAVFGNLLLGVAGLIGADARVPGMVLMRAPLGRRGSYLPTVVNVAQNLGWSTFELIIISTAAAALSDEVFGFEARWLWALLFGGIAVVLAVLGPIGFVRRFVRKFGIWAVAVSLVYLTWWTLDHSHLHAAWSASGKGGFPSFWQGVDLAVASIISWTPLAADYTRFSRDRRGAFWGTGVGYFLPTIWMFGLGVLLARLLEDPSDAAAIPAAVAAGGAVSVLALLALTVDETDEAFADIYSTAVSLQNILTWVPQRVLIVLVSTAATIGALVIDLGNYLTFLYLLGSLFIPLLGVLVADWLLAGAHYSREDVFNGPAVRPEQILAWIAGFALYQYLLPQGPGWWLDLIHHEKGPIDFTASLPSFVAAFGLSALAGLVFRRARVGLARA